MLCLQKVLRVLLHKFEGSSIHILLAMSNERGAIVLASFKHFGYRFALLQMANDRLNLELIEWKQDWWHMFQVSSE